MATQRHDDGTKHLPPPKRAEAERLAKRDRLNFRPWLWMHHHNDSEFAPLARLVLSGGPESIWVSKPIKPAQVCWDIEQFYASGQNGITPNHVKLARKAINAYAEDDHSVEGMIEEREAEEVSSSKQINQAAAAAAQEVAGDEIELMQKGNGQVWTGEAGIVRTTCDYVKPKTGRVCGRSAVPGANRCDFHGGQYLEPEQVKDMLRRSQEKVVAASEAAIEVVIDLMQNSVQDPVRLKAAEMLMDRAGLRPGMELTITGGGPGEVTDPSAVLRDRLDRLQKHFTVVDEDGNAVDD